MAFIERDVPWVGRLQIGRKVFVVDDPETSPHQFATEPFALLRSIHTEPRKVPVRKSWVSSVHLRENGEEVLMLLGRHAVGYHCDHCITIWFHVGRKPQRNTGKLAKSPDGVRRERISAKRHQECREIVQVSVRFGIHPADDWISCERRHEDIECPLPFGIPHPSEYRRDRDLLVARLSHRTLTYPRICVPAGSTMTSGPTTAPTRRSKTSTSSAAPSGVGAGRYA